MFSDFELELKNSVNYDHTINNRLFAAKYNIIKNMEFFYPTLMAISVIHEFGAHKYSFYSYLNTPYKSDANLENCIEATGRHLLLYRTGNTIDESGINHIAHIACRGGSMLLSRFYRTIMHPDVPQHPINRDAVSKCLNVVPGISENKKYPLLFLDQINPYVLISLMKFQDKYIPDTFDACLDVIHESVIRLSLKEFPKEYNPYKDIWYHDLILWNAAAALVYLPETKEQCQKYIYSIKDLPPRPNATIITESSISKKESVDNEDNVINVCVENGIPYMNDPNYFIPTGTK